MERVVVGVGDSRRAELAVKPAREVANRPHAPARHGARFDHDHALTGFAQTVGRNEPRQPGADDKDGFGVLCRSRAGLRD